MGIYFIAFNCLRLLQPFTVDMAYSMRGDLVFEKCSVTRSNKAHSEINVEATFNGEQLHITHYLTEECNFTSVPNAAKMTKYETKLFTRLPSYFFKWPDWNNLCKKLW